KLKILNCHGALIISDYHGGTYCFFGGERFYFLPMKVSTQHSRKKNVKSAYSSGEKKVLDFSLEDVLQSKTLKH
ncbi:MAG: hypothetical protein LBU69_06080, partial [Deltaproteobacteria bacterium]|nr:hypothetical protein [Deltaproteobacteria bacterium]